MTEMPSKISREMLLTSLQNLFQQLGDTPTAKQMDESGPYSAWTYSKRFGSWNQAVSEAGLSPNTPPRPSNEELLDGLKLFAEQLGRSPTGPEMVQKGPHSSSVYKNRFGSWNRALLLAGLRTNQPKEASPEELIAALQELSEKLGSAPTAAQMNSDGAFSVKPYRRVFGGWNKSLRAAGMEPQHAMNLSKTQLEKEIQRIVERIGRPPVTEDIASYSRFSLKPFVREFGSLSEARKAAGHPLPQRKAAGRKFGSNWPQQREKRIQKDREQCADCGLSRSAHYAEWGRDLDVHHIRPRAEFIHDEELSLEEDGNTLSNLLTLCLKCHKEREPSFAIKKS